MLDLHSGSEYGAARIAAMIAATITIILTGLVSFGFMVPYAQADSFGTLTINAVWNRDAASPKSLAGDTYAIVRVATVTTNSNGSVSSYKTVSDFSGLTADWERLTSSEYHDAAKKLAAHAAKNKLYQHSGTTNAAGQLTFQNLPLGLYLVSRTDSAKANKAYDCDPFLISIPGSGDTAADLNITVEPKFSTSTPPTPPEHEHNPGEMPGNPGVIGNTGAAVGGIAGVAKSPIPRPPKQAYASRRITVPWLTPASVVVIGNFTWLRSPVRKKLISRTQRLSKRKFSCLLRP